MNKTNRVKKTPLQIRAENSSSPEEFLRELFGRLSVGGLTRPNPVTANLQRRSAYKHLHGHVVGTKNIPKLLHAPWCLAGNAAAICYGTTRYTDNIDVLIDGSGEAYRETEKTLLENEWTPVLIDSIRTKHHPHFVVRSWWNITENIPKRGILSRRLNLIVPTRQLSEAVVHNFPISAIHAITSPVHKNWPMLRLETLIAMKVSLGRAIDIADIIEIIQGGAPFSWHMVRTLAIQSGFGCDDLIRQIMSIADEMPR
jgi:hypothetical protein